MPAILSFNELGLGSALTTALAELGYEQATPVQAQSIPILLQGHDLLAQAQTGTGKTAAFALPILANIDVKLKKPQAIVIAPTRELAIQVAEAFQSYAKHLKDFHVAPIYGGQDYRIQLKALKRGAHVIVGTPGRVMDHMRRESIELDALKTLVLDEADEMLNMGFIEDVEWILEQIPTEHQTALFSATVPPKIQKISSRYLNNAEHVKISPQKKSAASIKQTYMRVRKEQKLDILTSYLEVENAEAAIIFVRTKNDSSALAEKLLARGYAAAALNGDIKQALRKQVIDQIKQGKLDIIVATDVAARGIDVERITHVINYDVPHDTESYIHRIGRTGRAGRQGTALLMITPREQHLLKDIERHIQQDIEYIEPPSRAEMRDLRGEQLCARVTELLEKGKKIKPYYKIIQDLIHSTDAPTEDIAAALAYMLQESNPLPTQEFDTPEAEGGNKSRKRQRGKDFARHRSQSRKRGGPPPRGGRDKKKRRPIN